jgi:chaperone modulatory protein CbpM
MIEQDRENALPEDMLTVYDLACVTGMSARVIRRLISLEVIQPDTRAPEPYFRTEAVPRVRRMRRLHVELGVSWSSMPLVLELLSRIEELERRLG